MDIITIKEILELGFPAVILVLFILERRERRMVQREYLDSLRHFVSLPPVPEGEPHEIRVSWNGNTVQKEDSIVQIEKTP